MSKSFSLKLSDINKTFKGLDVPVLKNLNIEIKSGERLAINGMSGSGKSTLLHLMAGLDKPDSGSVKINNLNLHGISEKELSSIRNRQFGFIYQFHHLLNDFTAIENIMMPLIIRGGNYAEKNSSTFNKIIKKLSLSSRLHHYPHELSGGERQRVAIARAMITSPNIIFADEPTGNLDHKNAKIVFDLFMEMAVDFNTAIVLVTHDLSLAKKMKKIYYLSQGKLVAS